MRRHSAAIADPQPRGGVAGRQREDIVAGPAGEIILRRACPGIEGGRSGFARRLLQRVEQHRQRNVAAFEIEPAHVVAVEETPVNGRRTGEQPQRLAPVEAPQIGRHRRRPLRGRRHRRPVGDQAAQHHRARRIEQCIEPGGIRRNRRFGHAVGLVDPVAHLLLPSPVFSAGRAVRASYARQKTPFLWRSLRAGWRRRRCPCPCSARACR